MKQHRPATRAPHGSPEFTERLAANVTPAQKQAFMRKGGSGWLRRLIDKERQHAEVIRQAGILLEVLQVGSGPMIQRARVRLTAAINRAQE